VKTSDYLQPAPFFEKDRLGSETSRWRRIESEIVADCRVFSVRRDLSASLRDESTHDFYCIEAPDWVNIIPITPDDEVVMIEQYRHGTEEVTLEIPGGIVDPGEVPLEAAERELLEETGFGASRVVSLGRTRPNPAIQNNWLHSFAAFDVELKGRPVFTGSEHTTVRRVPLLDVPSLIADGTIDHALVVVAFYRLLLYRREGLSS
jgi:8-oxo-dGTP pyrophosphatase MutT (NUDIX family)